MEKASPSPLTTISVETVPKNIKPSNGIVWKSMVILLVVVIAVCEAQTFQYSRGWTNGKRSRGMETRFPSAQQQGAAQPFEIDVGVMELPAEESSVPLRINLSPQFRPRTSDYSNQEGGKGWNTQTSSLGWKPDGNGARKQLQQQQQQQR